MSGTCLTYKTVKIRKQQMCFSCLRKFEKGTNLKYQTGVYDGSFYSIYTCLTCDEIIHINHRKHHEDEFPEGYTLECLDKGETPEDYLNRLKMI